MKILLITLLTTALLVACVGPAPQGKNILVAEAFIDAFYSFDRTRLDSFLVRAESSKPKILYYPGSLSSPELLK